MFRLFPRGPTRHVLALTCALLLPGVLVSQARADAVASCVVDASDEEVARRLAWIETRLERGQPAAIAWWGGWLTYAAAEGVFGWVKYAHTEDRLDRDAWLVTGLGSTLWVAQMLLFPLTPAYSPRQMRRLPRADAGERRVSLARAERVLRDAAEAERENLHWAEHALDMAWAVGTGAYILGRSYGREQKARVWKETGLEFGLTVLLSEGAILSTPRKAMRDLAEYERMACVPDGSGPVRATRPRAAATRPWRFDVGPASVGLRLSF